MNEKRRGGDKMIKIEGDLHTHTISSGHAYSTLDEMVKAAARKDLKLIAITDHGPNLPGGPHEYYFGNLKVIPDNLYGIRVLKGVEANILDNGELDLEDSKLEKLEFVAAGIHADTGHNLQTKSDFTEATVKTMNNPLVNMITHPANIKYPLDFKKVVRAASKNDVIIEINASSFSENKIGKRGDIEKSLELCRLAKKYGVYLSLNSDAHFHTEVGDISNLNYIIKKANLREKDIINTSKERILKFLSSNSSRKQQVI